MWEISIISFHLYLTRFKTTTTTKNTRNKPDLFSNGDQANRATANVITNTQNSITEIITLNESAN